MALDRDLQDALASITGETKTIVQNLVKRLETSEEAATNMQKQLDAVDARGQRPNFGGGPEAKSLAVEISENPEFKRMAELGGRGKATIQIQDFQRKTLTNTAAGSSTSGVLPIDRGQGVVPIQFRALKVRDLLRSEPTTANQVDYVKVNTFTNNASPQVEASDKASSDMALTTVSAPVRTIAHWIPASKQIFDDLQGLAEAINTHLLYGLKLKEEQELLSGSNTGQHLNGLITQATAFDTSLLVAAAGWNRLDVIAKALQQAERADYESDVIVLNPDDFWAMALTKDLQGRYLFGDPSASTVPRLWGRPVSVTNTMGSGYFLVGSSQTALIRDRQEAIIEISSEHSDYFIKNMVAIRCESRLALVVTKPTAWIYGTFSTSPA